METITRAMTGISNHNARGHRPMKILHQNTTIDSVLIALATMVFTIAFDFFGVVTAVLLVACFLLATGVALIYIDSMRTDWAEPLIGIFTFEEGELG